MQKMTAPDGSTTAPLIDAENLSEYSNVLTQLNYGQPTALAGQVFESGGLRAFHFAARLAF